MGKRIIKADEIFARENVFGSIAKDWVIVRFGENEWLPRLEDQGIMCAYLWIAEQLKYPLPHQKGGEMVREYLNAMMDKAQKAHEYEGENAYNIFTPEVIFQTNKIFKIPNRDGINITKFTGKKS